MSAEETRTGNYSETTIDNAKVDDDAKATLKRLLGHTGVDGKKAQKNSAPKPQAERGNFVEKEGADTPKPKAVVPAVSPRNPIAKDAEAAKVEQPATVKNPAEEKTRLEKERADKMKALLTEGTTDAIDKFNGLKQALENGDTDTIDFVKKHVETLREIKALKAQAQFLDFIDSKDFDDYKNSLSPTKSNHEYKSERLERLATDRQNKINKKIHLWEKRAELGFGNQLCQAQKGSETLSDRSGGQTLQQRLQAFQAKGQPKLEVN